MIRRKKTRKLKVGGIFIGGDAPVTVQSMAKTFTSDVNATVKQLRLLKSAGCEVARVAVPDLEAAKCIGRIKKGAGLPLVADIHFNYELALEAIRQGADKVRINPGNMKKEHFLKVIESAIKASIPIRIGVNSGSLKEKAGAKNKAAAMVKAALDYIRMAERAGFRDMVISLKATDISLTVAAYEMISAKTAYPLHLGLTEAGAGLYGTVKSAVAIGSLLVRGIGDTIRVSLTGPPEEEVKAGRDILKSLKLRNFGPEVISCPTCGRCRLDVAGIARKVNEGINRLAAEGYTLPSVKVAVMGCEVNGPGEARDAYLGIAGGNRTAVLFKEGKIRGRLKEREAAERLLAELKKS